VIDFIRIGKLNQFKRNVKGMFVFCVVNLFSRREFYFFSQYITHERVLQGMKRDFKFFIEVEMLTMSWEMFLIDFLPD